MSMASPANSTGHHLAQAPGGDQALPVATASRKAGAYRLRSSVQLDGFLAIWTIFGRCLVYFQTVLTDPAAALNAN
jgi:hypothetical protein